MRSVAFSGVVLISITLVGCCEPTGKISPSSQTPACETELTNALATLARDNGLAFTASGADAKAVIGTGQVEKTYARDGVKYGAHFGVVKESSGCQLRFFKRSTSEPGQSKTTMGNYGSVPLTVCRCE